MTMEDWSKRLDLFLMADDRENLRGAGQITAEIAKVKAECEFEKYRIAQDRLFMSDYDKYLPELEKNAVLIKQGKNQKERMKLLRQLAVHQLQTLETHSLTLDCYLFQRFHFTEDFLEIMIPCSAFLLQNGPEVSGKYQRNKLDKNAALHGSVSMNSEPFHIQVIFRVVEVFSTASERLSA